MVGQGALSTLLRRERRNKPNIHYELRISGEPSLRWFVENVGRHCHLTRKKQYLTEQYLPSVKVPTHLT